MNAEQFHYAIAILKARNEGFDKLAHAITQLYFKNWPQ